MKRRVRGVLFTDYVRMARGRKDIDWTKYLEPDDLAVVAERIDPDGWYPMETFERLGVGILEAVALGQLEAVRMWGRFQVDTVRARYPTLLAEGDPRETMMRFQVLRTTFFDFDALKVILANDQHGVVEIAYQMGPVAEEAASNQTLGFFERLLEMAGAASVYARFASESWRGARVTRVELDWD